MALQEYAHLACTYVLSRIHTNTHMYCHAYVLSRVHTYVVSRIHTNTHICIVTHMYCYAYTHMYCHAYTLTHTYTKVDTQTRTNKQMHTQTHTHKHTRAYLGRVSQHKVQLLLPVVALVGGVKVRERQHQERCAFAVPFQGGTCS